MQIFSFFTQIQIRGFANAILHYDDHLGSMNLCVSFVSRLEALCNAFNLINEILSVLLIVC